MGTKETLLYGVQGAQWIWRDTGTAILCSITTWGAVCIRNKLIVVYSAFFLKASLSFYPAMRGEDVQYKKVNEPV